MIDTSFETVRNGDIELRVAVGGDGPLILFVHGWPEIWYSWRHQMTHLGERGFRVAAMDVRGYGGSSKPTDVAAYTLRELCGDAAAVIDAVGDGHAVVVGHDWGAPTAWNTARLHPSKVRAVVGLSVPYLPVGPVSSLELWKELYADRFFYQNYFQEPGVAEAELGADNARSLRMIWYAGSGDRPGGLIAEKPADAKMLDGMIDPDPFPAWSTPEDQQVYIEAFDAGGWTGPLNRYRAQGLDAEQLGSLTDPAPELRQPAAFIAGELDSVRNFVPGLDLFELAGAACQNFRGSTIVPGVGHWVQQEAPDATNAALTDFITGL
jgi:pimeloyl-ACP methyl ester carboxylesterase